MSLSRYDSTSSFDSNTSKSNIKSIDTISTDSSSSSNNSSIGSFSSSETNLSSSSYSSNSETYFKFPFKFKTKDKLKKNTDNKIIRYISISPKEYNITYIPPYNSIWFQTDNNYVDIKTYLDKLFILSRKNFSLNINPNTIKAIIVPHDSLKFSGLCSATCYQPLLLRTKPIKRIIMFITNHTNTDNIISTSYINIKPILGNKQLNIDTKIIYQLKNFIEINNNIFEIENAFFNQIPFLEYIAPDAVILPLLINNTILINKESNIKLVSLLSKLKQIIEYNTNGIKKNENIIICSSNFSNINGYYDNINGYYENKINNSTLNNIIKQDNEILQFIYNKVNGIKSRCNKIDDTLFINNSPSFGTMSLYLFSIFMNLLYDNSYYSSSDSSNCSTNDSDYSSNSNNSQKKIKKLYSRISCHYISPQIDTNININNFNINNLSSYMNLKNTMSSKSYEGVIFTTQQYLETDKARSIQNILTEYEKLCINTYIKDYLYSKVNINNIDYRNLQTINTPIFKMNINIFIIVKDKENNARYCISSFDKQKNEDANLLSNIRMLIDIMLNTNTNYNGNIYKKLSPEDIINLDIDLYIMGSILSIQLTEYYNNKFNLDSDLLLNKDKDKFKFVFSPIEKNLNNKLNKKNLIEKLLNLNENELQNNKYKMNNLELFYIECLKI